VPSATRRLRTAVAGACVVVLAGCSSGSGTGQQASVSFAPGHRKVAPDLSGTTLAKGQQFSLAAERGHVVVVNFWASWCAPCLDEAPYLQQVWQDTHDQGVTFIGIAFHGDAENAARAFLASHNVPYDSLYDPDSADALLLAKAKVSVASPPLTLVIDKQGRVATIINGEVVYTELLKAVRTVNAEPAAA
jgi:thiol-disulfide isomerase/thioredoxin